MTTKFIALFLYLLPLFCTAQQYEKNNAPSFSALTLSVLRKQILQDAAWALKQSPVTVTASSCARSAGNKHSFYSEGDYWWPNPVSVDSPYIQRDGLTNPGNFTAHRHAMIRLSQVTGALAAAYLISGENRYVQHALQHYKAWFIDSATMMNPDFLFAQAIKGRFTGRGIGIIDGIQLMDAVQALMVMQQANGIDKKIVGGTKKWFAQLLHWLTTHPYGISEMNAANNHGTCWVMQAALFAKFIGDSSILKFCSTRFKNILLPGQMAADGSFPLELKRTKPYGYSIFNLDAMTTICQILSSPADNLWQYETAGGRCIRQGIEYLYPYIAHKNNWPLAPDVMYWNNWPVAQTFLIFGANAYNNVIWFDTWRKLNHSPETDEVIRNLPVRNPLIWLK